MSSARPLHSPELWALPPEAASITYSLMMFAQPNSPLHAETREAGSLRTVEGQPGSATWSVLGQSFENLTKKNAHTHTLQSMLARALSVREFPEAGCCISIVLQNTEGDNSSSTYKRDSKARVQVHPAGQAGYPISLVASLDTVPVKCCVPLQVCTR